MEIQTTGLLATAALITVGTLGACVPRWEAPTVGPVQFTEACPDRRAPLIEDFGSTGLRAVYNFVVQDASQDDLGLLFRQSREQGFGLAPVTININGHDTLFATGAAALHRQSEVDAEFRSACRMGGGKVYLTHVRYNPEGDQNEQVRVR